MTDYAIARRIVDLHSRLEKSIERVYSVDDIRRYILFARQFRPKVSECKVCRGVKVAPWFIAASW